MPDEPAGQVDWHAIWSAIGWEVVLGSVIALAIFNLLLGPMLRRAGIFGLLLFGRARALWVLPEHLDAYRRRLYADLFRLHHDWMQGDQMLGDVLVPISVLPEPTLDDDPRRSRDAVLDFTPTVKRFLGGGGGRLLVVLGEPGAGKSVALKLAVRAAWDGMAQHDRLPIHLTFARLRKAGFDIEAALPEALTHHGFGDAELARQSVAERLTDDRLLLVLDGLDELPRDARQEAIRAVVKFGRDHPGAPLIVGCRTVPYATLRAQLVPLGPRHLTVAPFSDAARRAFVRKWRFSGEKSPTDLLDAIARQPHLDSLSRNPLSLTIIAYLYSQPLYRLPENRSRFYALCARALLEEWDNTQAIDRANQLVRAHKEAALARLALEHLDSATPEADLDADAAAQVIAACLESRGIKGQMSAVALAEIRDNAGLLIPIPPGGLRFPHQTFLEFFAALALHQANDVDGMLNRWRAEPARWRETLLLFVGLREDADAMSRILTAVCERDIELAVEVMLDASAVGQADAERVFAAAERALQAEPTARLVHGLGFIARNPQSTHDARAYAALARLFARLPDPHLPAAVADATVLAMSRAARPADMQRLVDEFQGLRLAETLPRMGSAARVLAERVVRSGALDEAALLIWVEHLRQAGLCDVIFEVWCAATDAPKVQYAAAFALARLSTTPEWQALLDAVERRPPVPDDVAALADRWGWRGLSPTHAVGRAVAARVAVMTGRVLSGAVDVGQDADGRRWSYWDEMPELHPSVGYLAHASVPVEALDWNWNETAPEDAFGVWRAVAASLPMTRRSIWRCPVTDLAGAHGERGQRERVSETLNFTMFLLWGFCGTVAIVGWCIDSSLIAPWTAAAVLVLALIAGLLAGVGTVFEGESRKSRASRAILLGVVMPLAPTILAGKLIVARTQRHFQIRRRARTHWSLAFASRGTIAVGVPALASWAAPGAFEAGLWAACSIFGALFVTVEAVRYLLGWDTPAIGAYLDPQPEEPAAPE